MNLKVNSRILLLNCQNVKNYTFELRELLPLDELPLKIELLWSDLALGFVPCDNAYTIFFVLMFKHFDNCVDCLTLNGQRVRENGMFLSGCVLNINFNHMEWYNTYVYKCTLQLKNIPCRVICYVFMYYCVVMTLLISPNRYIISKLA